jgi:ABC-type cobalamin/Fe3+-siderophores transport system ATPase subunit
MSARHPKRFNTTGPCVPEEHYMLPALPRLPGVDDLIEGKSYFIIHAPRQSGKTTFLKFLTKKINSSGKMYALSCSFATLRSVKDRIEAITTIVSQINKSMKLSSIESIREKAYKYDALPGMKAPDTKVSIILNQLCLDLDRDLVVFFDEADVAAK